MPSIFSRSKTRGSQASISNPYPYERSAPGSAPYPPQSSSAQFPPHHFQPSYAAETRAPQAPNNPNLIDHPPLNLQRPPDGSFISDPPASNASPTAAAHESPNIDQRDSEPKRSFRERFGLTGGISRENLQDSTEEQGSTARLRRKASSRKKEPYQYSPQSPPPSGGGRATPPFGKRRPLDIPEETHESETENLRDLAAFFRSTAPPSDPRRRPVSLVGDPTSAQAHWNKLNPQAQTAGEQRPPGSRPRSGSLGDSLERGPSSKPPEALQTNPLSTSPGGPTQIIQPQYQAYHPAPGPSPVQETRQQPALPPLQTQVSQVQSQGGSLHLASLSPLRQNPVDQRPGQSPPFQTESPPHFEVQGPDQQRPTDSLEHGAASELTGHLVGQQAQPVLGSAPRQIVSPTKETSPGMPSNSANLQLPPRRGSVQDGSEPPTPNAVNQNKMQQPANQGVQRAQTTTEGAAGRSTPPPQITARDLSEEEVNNLLRDYKELREKYSKVKRYYFDKDAQVQTLQNALAHQKLSQSRTSLDDGEYMQRLQRLDGLISQLSFGFRKDWKTLPGWLQPFVNKDAITIGKQEMTAVGRAFISRWLVDEVFNKYFHPGLDLEVSKELKAIQNNIRGYGTAMQTGEEEEALTAKIINWRLATVDGLYQTLNSAEATSRRQNLIELLDAQLVTSLTEFMHETPAGLEGGVHMITELAVTILMHLPSESRDVNIEYFYPGTPFNEHIMKAEQGIPPLGTPMAEPVDSDRISVHSDRSDADEPEESVKAEKQEHRRGFFKEIMGNKKPPPAKAGSAAASQNSLLQPPGSSGGPKEDRVRLCVFLGLSIRGKMVLSTAPVFKTS